MRQGRQAEDRCPFLGDRYLYLTPTPAVPAQSLVRNPAPAYKGYIVPTVSCLVLQPACVILTRGVSHCGGGGAGASSAFILMDSFTAKMTKYTTILTKESSPSPAVPTFEVLPW